MNGKHIVLDLDGVLVDGYVARPGLKEFLAFLFSDPQIETVSIWTASLGWWPVAYHSMIRKLMPEGKSFWFVWEGDRCTSTFDFDSGERIQVKPLKKVWKAFKPRLNKTNTVIFDDSPFTFQRNYGNAIGVKSFEDHHLLEKEDKEFQRLQSLLSKYILPAADVRTAIRSIHPVNFVPFTTTWQQTVESKQPVPAQAAQIQSSDLAPPDSVASDHST